ncbi:MAG TPA: efflux RND transporter periplasmic adaptor subunit [Myxococcota bacterium]|nr:efflux RND transporter periplasmic adaptor subunit [Myxococcota bacterium]
MNTPVPPKADQGASLNELLKTESSGRLKRRLLWLGGALVVLVGAGLLFFLPGDQAVGPRYRTEPATVGTLVVKVSATGNLQPTNNVQVSSEQSGIVTEVLVDDNDRVVKDQVLARLDLSKLEDAVAKSRASLVAAEAQVLQAEATVAEARAALARFRQVAELSGGKVPSRAELDTAEANLKRAEAGEASARASVTQARANLQSDVTNLGKATIRSPIDGVVLTRSVEPGQTVAAMFQAPVLFTLAEDLAKMELQVDIDEADVGQVKVGQQATFGVDAWPGRKYTGVITRVGYGSQTKDGVVSYPTVIAVANGDLSLRPGMTGTADIVTVTREGALLVPNAALRFSPATAGPAATGPGGGFVGKLMPRPPRQAPKVQAPPSDGKPRVWVLRAGQPAPLEVQTGASNGQLTEITGGSLEAGAEVITETLEALP